MKEVPQPVLSAGELVVGNVAGKTAESQKMELERSRSPDNVDPVSRTESEN